VPYLTREVALEECLRVSPDPNEFLRMTGEKPIEEQDIASAQAGGKLASARR
jgi:hypothetical protein